MRYISHKITANFIRALHLGNKGAQITAQGVQGASQLRNLILTLHQKPSAVITRGHGHSTVLHFLYWLNNLARQGFY